MKHRYSKEQYSAHLKQLRGKAALHGSIGAAVILASLNAMIEAVDSDGFEAIAKEYSEMVQRAHEGDATARAEVTKLRQTRINNYLIARSNWMPFFNMITLADNEVAEYIHESRQECKVSVSTGADGGWFRSQIVKYKSHVQVGLFPVATELIEYQLWDPIFGNVADEIKALIDLAGDLDQKINKIAKTYVAAACVDPFTITGAKAGRTFAFNSDVDMGNIPTTNQLDASSATRFSKLAMDKVLAYCSSFGNVFGEVIRPEMVILPALDATGQLADISITSQQNDLTSQIFGGGQIIDYGGTKWNIFPDVTLKPSDGFAYVLTNRKIGDFFHKPGGDKIYDNPMKDGPLGNTGEMGMRKWIGFATPKPWNPFVIRVKYK